MRTANYAREHLSSKQHLLDFKSSLLHLPQSHALVPSCDPPYIFTEAHNQKKLDNFLYSIQILKLNFDLACKAHEVQFSCHQ